MNILFLYLISVINSISKLFLAIFITWLTVSIFIALHGLLEKDFKYFEIAKSYKKIGIASLLLFVLIPDKKDIAMIYIVPQIVDSKVIQNDLPEIYKLGIEALKNQLVNQVKHE